MQQVVTDNKPDVASVGARLKALRENNGLTMRELAAASGVSASLISKIEAGKVSPTVMSLQKLLDGMDVDLYEFFLERHLDDPSRQVVFRRSEMATAEDEEHRWFFAFPRHPSIEGQLTYEEYQPRTKAAEEESHRGDVCGLVLSGELTLDVAGSGRHRVSSGDAFYIKAGQRHIARNDSDSVLKLAAVQIRRR